MLRWAIPLLTVLLALGLLPLALRWLRLVWRLIRDRRVPFLLRLLVPLAVVYLISPLDLIPDRWRVLGWADDLLLLLLAAWLLVRLSPRHVVQEHRGRGAGPEPSASDPPPGKVAEGRGRVIR